MTSVHNASLGLGDPKTTSLNPVQRSQSGIAVRATVQPRLHRCPA
jgi:hypothetical protein